ncbi:hypothetical protein [Parafrankia sp. BMG5.11]|uniref:hypothetical protein n=1 Tax=Parafrankia sp. BMG5.11 TaxID=222540 RepID=UPI00103D5DAF|nr:hypothetical protein [Parafrankia sp. BMG5.11]TCJ36855.1 hypothetical protein E0504_21495 [Parafrankia sp. BMG5.11]
MKAPGWVERFLVMALPALLGAGVFAVAFAHIVELAVWAGQPAWSAVLLACTGEAMAVAAILEIRHRQYHGGSLVMPVIVLVAAVVFSGACNLAAALADRDPVTGRLAGEPGVWRPTMAVWVVVAFGCVAGLKATRSHTAAVEQVAPAAVEVAPVPERTPEPVTAPAPPPAPEPPAAGTGATSRGSGRHVLAELVAKLPADDPRSERQLAADLAPVAGLAPSTARRYLGDLRKTVAA